MADENKKVQENQNNEEVLNEKTLQQNMPKKKKKIYLIQKRFNIKKEALNGFFFV